MKSLLLVFFAIFGLCKQLNAQQAESYRLSMLSAGLGYSKNTFYHKGDFGGVFCSASYLNLLRKRLGYEVKLAGTIHDGKSSILYYDEDNSIWKNGELRYITGGLQVSTELDFFLMSRKNQFLAIGLGPVIRYQITTFPKYGWYNFYPASFFEEPRYSRTFAIGGGGSIRYGYIFKNCLLIQANASLQFDSNNDAVNMFGISLGRVFPSRIDGKLK